MERLTVRRDGNGDEGIRAETDMGESGKRTDCYIGTGSMVGRRTKHKRRHTDRLTETETAGKKSRVRIRDVQ